MAIGTGIPFEVLMQYPREWRDELGKQLSSIRARAAAEKAARERLARALHG